MLAFADLFRENVFLAKWFGVRKVIEMGKNVIEMGQNIIEVSQNIIEVFASFRKKPK